MGKKQLNLTYATKNNCIVSIDDVERGLKCGCICPACGDVLIAKKGQKMMHHFAHHSGHNCEYGYESSLHLAAKEILSKAKKFNIPPVNITFPNSYKKPEQICASKDISIDHVELEKRYDGVIPDIAIYSGEKQLFVEIFVTHRVDDEKLKKLQNADISTIQIDLSSVTEMITTEELKILLLGNSDRKEWIYNSLANIWLKRFYRISDKRDIVSRGFASHVDDCPIKTRIWRGKPYANFIDDCLYCEYCVSGNYEGMMLCSGKHRVATISDFNVPESVRIKENNDRINNLKDNAFAGGSCPNCGGKFIERKSKYGVFLGCDNYPHCRFTASPDPVTGEIKMKS